MTVKTYYMVAGRPVIDKDPIEELDYAFDLRAYLEKRDEQIAPGTGSISIAAGLTQLAFDYDEYTATYKVSGGVLDAPLYAISFIFRTTGGRKVKRTIYIRVKSL